MSERARLEDAINTIGTEHWYSIKIIADYIDALESENAELRRKVEAAEALADCIRVETIDGETWYGMDHANIVNAYETFRATATDEGG